MRVAGAMYSNIQDCDEGSLDDVSHLILTLTDLNQSSISGNLCTISIEAMASRLGKHRQNIQSVAGPISAYIYYLQHS